jgi:nucleotidyltransferase substrate binding protein (TIGR01987 family)
MAQREEIENQFRKFENALKKLEEVLQIENYNDIVRDSAIKRFEFTFEMLWKIIKKISYIEGKPCNSPRQCFKFAFSIGLIEDENLFLEMLEYRNLTVHTYYEFNAQKVYEFLKEKGILAFKKIYEKLKTYIFYT